MFPVMFWLKMSFESLEPPETATTNFTSVFQNFSTDFFTFYFDGDTHFGIISKSRAGTASIRLRLLRWDCYCDGFGITFL